ncbi:MAG: SGNH/GDSL hydrolase family protein [Opitutaceae bacterium]|nr:SGNH/GDSL hydrolase family protein [Opitutaceae bacterium]
MSLPRLGRWAGVFLATVTMSSATTPLADRIAAGEETRIVCFGDSITGIYYHTGGHRAWSHLLGDQLKQSWPGARLIMINAGVSGNTTADALARLDADVLAHRPHLVVMKFGMNDTARLSAETFRAYLHALCDRIRGAGSEILLLTPNAVEPGDAGRPPEKVAAYAAIVREVGRARGVNVADVYAAFAAVQASAPADWLRLMSDTIHPNLRGHALIAGTAAAALTGRPVGPAQIPPRRDSRRAPFARTAEKLQAGQPVHVLAMAPLDTMIAAAIRREFPAAAVHVTRWETAGKSLATLEADATAEGWMKYRNQTILTPPDLVLVAVPASAEPAPGVPYYRTFGGILNRAQWFDGSGWDCVVVLPSMMQPDLPPAEAEREQIALAAARDKDVPVIQRTVGHGDNAEALLIQMLHP